MFDSTFNLEIVNDRRFGGSSQTLASLGFVPKASEGLNGVVYLGSIAFHNPGGALTGIGTAQSTRAHQATIRVGIILIVNIQKVVVICHTDW